MTKIKNNCILFVILLLMILISIFFIWDFNTGNATKLDEVKLKENNQISKGLAIMLENDTNDGKYAESQSGMWPSSTDYRFNKELSGCIDNDGNTIEDALTYNKSTNSVSIKTKSNISCYMYFDLKFYLSELCESGDTLGSCITDNNEEIDSLNNNIEGGLYRYQGTNIDVDDNYICFGTGDKEECTSNTDAYMYRIIGIDSNGQLKLIKKESLNNGISWYSNSTTDITWIESNANSEINGSSFLTNSTYMPSGWSNKIVDYDWKYGSSTDIKNYNSIVTYEIENNWENIVNEKIGLMYAYDYYYAYSSKGPENYVTASTAWIHINHNDLNPPSTIYEWTISMYGYNEEKNSYFTWGIQDDGSIDYCYMASPISVRPVFYLNADEQYISGDGTLDNPIMLEAPKIPIGEYLLENPTSGLDTTTPYSGMYRYIGTNTATNNYVKLGNEANEVLYRILGIVSEDNETLGLEKEQLKLIKHTSIGTYQWNNDYTVDTKWESSTIYSYLQGSKVLDNENIITKGWADNLSNVKWYVGDVQTWTNGDTVYGLEDNLTTNETSKIGLMYLSDYFYAYTAGGGINCASTVCTNWLTDTSNTAWTMSRYGYVSTISAYGAYYVGPSGTIGLTTYRLTDTFEIRPVFYLTKDVYITNPEATGTSTDPFILSY